MYENKKAAVIIAAGGRGSRMGIDTPKQFITLCGKTILERAVLAFEENAYIDEIHIVTGADFEEGCRAVFLGGGYGKVVSVLSGGAERQDSVYNALKRLDASIDIVLIHDGVRPFVTQLVINKVLSKAADFGAAVAAVAVKDTIKTAYNGIFTDTLERDRLQGVQTPQAFSRVRLLEAYEAAFKAGFYGTDDAVLMERVGHKVFVSEGDYRNLKITTKEDLIFGQALLGGENAPRIGTGYDVHRLVPGRECILGGVNIPFDRGLLGHSDADVLLHAIMDAMLGAAALGDIGKHFPDTEEEYRGISSLELLKKTGQLTVKAGYGIGNIDATVIAEKPKIAPYIAKMRANVAEALDLALDKISIKATTTEKLGFCGREEGIAAQAVVLLIG